MPTVPRFFVDVSVRLHRLATKEGRPADEIQRVGFAYPAIGVGIEEGPERLEVGVPSEVRLSIEASDTMGPGVIRRRESYWIEEGKTVLGLATVLRVSPIGAGPDAAGWPKERRSVRAVTPDAGAEIVCPRCGARFSMHDRWKWTGLRHRTCGQRIELVGVERQVEPIWCLVGNIVRERAYGPGGLETRHGTKALAPNAKVYCYPPLWGDGYQHVKVVGLARKSRALITIVVRGALITNRRAKLVYTPAIVDRLSGYWDGTQRSRELAESLTAGGLV